MQELVRIESEIAQLVEDIEAKVQEVAEKTDALRKVQAPLAEREREVETLQQQLQNVSGGKLAIHSPFLPGSGCLMFLSVACHAHHVCFARASA